ncbi:glycoside hydrolase family 16 protein [Streptomyces sp. CRN 30]|uniref:glycoside hydrolase family 16 protein n=1 Tax=Streptomyces sp. CRN 30 TaxID=3075613 RepID=UPI002A8352AD|nr:glycoside hydrolase family 16 protein [Streptomyces sp. CRN 30]
MPKHARPRPRSLRIGILVTAGAVTTTALSLAGAADGNPSGPRVTQLALGPGYLAAGESAAARLEIAADRCVTASRITVAVRDESGRNVDFPDAASGVRLCPSGHTFTSGQRAFPAGTYTMFGSWRDGEGTWHPLPSAELKVGKAAPSASTAPPATSTTSTASPAASPPPASTPAAPSTDATDATGTAGSAGSAGSAARPTWDESGTWRLRFSDDFDGDALDTAKWNTGWFGTGVTGPVNSAEDACYDERNIRVSGGALRLRLTDAESSCKGASRPYSGAHVNTMGKFSYSYGAVEYRARVPAEDGEVANWPALWDTGEFWPRDGETDTMEGLSGEICSYWHSTGTDRGHCPSGERTGWHTFGHRWEPGRITWYYDGKAVHTQSSGVVGSPHYLVMQNTQGSFGGPTLTPADLEVDYVRVWSE